jgi:glycosyltransferase involved in cell wall biosynthesis
MAQADCLVLPSVHDGWGAVISEALMVGTPVICSDACGAAGVVKASGSGGVFRRDRFDELQFELNKQLQSGSIDIDNRIRIASWARALDANAGARYLINIFDYSINGGIRPSPPWQKVENE